MGEGEARASAPEARLDLVEDQGDAVLVAERPQMDGDVGIEQPEAALALHRLDDDGRHLVDGQLHLEETRQGAQRLVSTDVAVATRKRQVMDRPRQSAQAVLVGLDLAVEVERREGAAVKAVIEGDHSLAAGGGAGHLERVLGGLGPAVGQHAGERIGDRHEGVERLSDLQVAAMRQGVEGRVHEPVDLRLDRLHHRGMAVAEVEHADAADEVDVVPALLVPELGVAAALHA